MVSKLIKTAYYITQYNVKQNYVLNNAKYNIDVGTICKYVQFKVFNRMLN